MAASGFDYVWRLRKWLGARHGQACRVLVRGRQLGSILVEFEDGTKVVTFRHAVRRA